MLGDLQFVALESMEVDTKIYFTDHGYNGGTSNSLSDLTSFGFDGTNSFNADANVEAGSTFGVTFNHIEYDGANSSGPASDQIIAFQNDGRGITYLFAINFNNNNGAWSTSIVDNTDSFQPPGLIDGLHILNLNIPGNARYNHGEIQPYDLVGSRADILAELCDENNWESFDGITAISTNFVSTTTWSGTGWDHEVGEVPNDYFKVIIDEDYNIGTDGEFTTSELQIKSGSTLTVPQDNTFTIRNRIQVDSGGLIKVQNGGSILQIRKDATVPHELNEVDYGSGFEVERKTTDLAEWQNYTYWSSPLLSSILGNVVSTSNYYSYKPENVSGEITSGGWFAESSGSTMAKGLGYAMTGDSSADYSSGTYQHTALFSGSPFNNGEVSVDLNDGGAAIDFSLLGNPYPSAIQISSFLSSNENVIASLYFWTHVSANGSGNNTQSDYIYVNSSGTNALLYGEGGFLNGNNCVDCGSISGSYIASGQGFMVSHVGVGSVVFNNSMRVSGNNTTTFHRSKKVKSSEVLHDKLWLNLKAPTHNSSILIGFQDEATDGFDVRYDTEIMSSGADIAFYSNLEGGKYAIQGKDLRETYEEVSLGFDANTTGDFSISIAKIQGQLTQDQVLLRDNDLGLVWDLQQGDYAFENYETGSFTDRFHLLLGTNEVQTTLAVNNIEGHTGVKTYIKDTALKVQSISEIEGVTVYDALGKSIAATVVLEKENLLSIARAKTPGIHILHIRFKNGSSSKVKVLL
ncbi:MAG: hypothetical protein ACPH2K_01785 [Flavicella sp.]